MILNSRTEIIVGPPGTGKTTYLINKVRQLVSEGVRMSDIGYISFTRQAIKEARERISVGAELEPHDIIGFRTLHSITFWLLGKNTYDLLEPEAYRSILPEPWPLRWIEAYANMYQYHRVTGEPLSQVWENFHGFKIGTEENFLKWIQAYQTVKQKRGKFDFMDVVQEFSKKQVAFPFRHLFLDEAQDFTPDQWEAVKLLARHAGQVYIAGDPEQSIFEWAGAKRSILKSVQGKVTVLSQSYRIPSTVHEVAKRVLDITGEEILYSPRQERGSVNIIDPDLVPGLPFENGESWFLLARETYQVDKVRMMLWHKGIYHSTLNVKDFGKGLEDKGAHRIKMWEKILTQEEYKPQQITGLVKDSISKEFLGKAFENKYPWQRAFDQWSFDKINYYQGSEHIWRAGPAKVHIGTMHSCKGSEADNVVIFGTTGKRSRGGFEEGETESWRLLYVALTRAKKNLFLAPAKGKGIPFEKLFPADKILEDSRWMNTYQLGGLSV
jgi:DNA helicase II / ATP-dependent DNA helicase PcrA